MSTGGTLILNWKEKNKNRKPKLMLRFFYLLSSLCLVLKLEMCNLDVEKILTMKPSINIRKIKAEDLDFVYKSICELENEVFDLEIFKSIFNENLSNPNHLYLIAESGNESLGFITFHVQNLMHHCGLVGEIQEFFIDKNHRGKGVGRKLVDEIIQYSKQNNLKSIEVTTNKKRVENVAIYENLGFTLSHNKFTILK